MTQYPYMMANNKIAAIISKIQTAAKPQKFTQEFLKNIGFSSSNDRTIITILKKLCFLSEDGIPTVYYDQLRDKSLYKTVLAQQIRELYSELFTINIEIYKDTDENIKGAISRVTGEAEKSVIRIFNTFKALCALADFTTDKHLDISSEVKNDEYEGIDISQKSTDNLTVMKAPTEFHYNIQIHLPATTDISVYNAIFKSLKDNLLI